MKKLSICALLTTRNEAPYLQKILPHLASLGIDVAVIDNESTDGSRALYAQYGGAPVISVETLPYRGFFSLTEALAAEDAVCKKLKHDWIIHHDADEILEHREPGESLRDAIEQADTGGHNVVNFEEFVFLPAPGEDYSGRDYHREMLRYYFFAPKPSRLNRAWKRAAKLDNRQSGGHILLGAAVKVAPVSHVMRHYIVLSQEHAWRKYLHRTFDPAEPGWHENRRNFTRENLMLPPVHKGLFQLQSHESRDFHRDIPLSKHFWEWHG